jgi:anti-sigma factor RsiW
MRRPSGRHYTEEELLMHLLGEEDSGLSAAVASHLQDCSECLAVFQEYSQLYDDIRSWRVKEIPEDQWEENRSRLMSRFREERELAQRGMLHSLVRVLRGYWNYALENPLPTLGYVIVAIAFASERTISVFRLDRIIPGTNEVLQILRQVL